MVGKYSSLLLISSVLVGCSTNGPMVSGSAGGSTSAGADSVRRCNESLGTLAIDDSRRESWWGSFVQNTRISNLEPMIRLVVQQSNCFVITSIGNASLDSQMSRITNEQRNGEFRAGSNQQKGQRVAADFYLQPTIVFSDGGVSNLFAAAPIGRTFAAVAGQYKESTAQVSMSLFNIRAGVQIAESEGTGTASNFGSVLDSFGGNGGTLAAYTGSTGGKATLSGFVDSYNKLVVAVQNYKEQTVRGGLGTGGLLKVQGQ